MTVFLNKSVKFCHVGFQIFLYIHLTTYIKKLGVFKYIYPNSWNKSYKIFSISVILKIKIMFASKLSGKKTSKFHKIDHVYRPTDMSSANDCHKWMENFDRPTCVDEKNHQWHTSHPGKFFANFCLRKTRGFCLSSTTAHILTPGISPRY